MVLKRDLALYWLALIYGALARPVLWRKDAPEADPYAGIMTVAGAHSVFPRHTRSFASRLLFHSFCVTAFMSQLLCHSFCVTAFVSQLFHEMG